MTTRRNFLAYAAASSGLFYGASAIAQSTPGSLAPALVEVFNFRCPRCRAVSDWSSRIQEAAKLTNVEYRPASISWTQAELWPDRFYYAARDLYPATAPVIREVLFSGIHDYGQPFEELAQILAYMESSGGDARALAADPRFNLVAVADRAGTDEALYPILKVVRLLDLTDAEEVPVFIWVRGGSVIKVVSPADAAEPAVLARRVIADLNSKS